LRRDNLRRSAGDFELTLLKPKRRSSNLAP
jgi:hypothetical protein